MEHGTSPLPRLTTGQVASGFAAAEGAPGEALIVTGVFIWPI
jgi:hypothetical protein